MFARLPKSDGGHPPASGDDGISESDLSVQFERSSLNCECAGRRSRLRGLVDDPGTDAEPGQPQRQNQTRWSGAYDENISVNH
jgi:hypothetical protein